MNAQASREVCVRALPTQMAVRGNGSPPAGVIYAPHDHDRFQLGDLRLRPGAAYTSCSMWRRKSRTDDGDS